MSEPVDRFIGAKIRARRQELGMQALDLAEMIGTTASQVSRYESGETSVKPPLMGRLSEVLKVKITYFMEGFRK